jgi:enoyl-CoA hydratase/carnithine racemase
MSQALMTGLTEGLEEAAAEPTVRVIVVTSEVPGVLEKRAPRFTDPPPHS